MMLRTPPIARRIQNLPDYPFAIVEKRIQELKKNGKNIVRMDVGSPDLPPPPAVIQALIDSASRDDSHGYAGYRGTAEFRQAVARYYKRRFDVDLDSNTEVLPLLGSKEGIVNLMLATVGEGDTVLVPSLGYPAYTMGARLANAEPYFMPCQAENNFLPVLENIPMEIREQAALLWLSYPNNPTGVFASVEYYAQAIAFCRENNILLASDNPYLEVVFDDEPHAPSALQVPDAKDVSVEFISMSKSHNMAGWRLGAMVGNAQIVAELLTVKSNIDSGHFKAIYDAGVVALDTTPQSWIDERNARYAARRDKIMAVLNDIGLAVGTTPKGSLYIWAKVQDGDDVAYSDKALLEAGVSISPGSFFGDDGRGYVRISLGINDNQLDEALQRLQACFADS